MELKSGGRILCAAGDPRQTFVAKSTKMVFLSVMGNRVRAVVLPDTTGDRNQPDSGEIAVCGDRDDVRAAYSRSGKSWLCRGQRYEGYRRCPAAGVRCRGSTGQPDGRKNDGWWK